jgi:hypothetical protein
MKERGKKLRKESESRRKKERTKKKKSNEIMKDQVELPVLADTSLQIRHSSGTRNMQAAKTQINSITTDVSY